MWPMHGSIINTTNLYPAWMGFTAIYSPWGAPGSHAWCNNKVWPALSYPGTHTLTHMHAVHTAVTLCTLSWTLITTNIDPSLQLCKGPGTHKVSSQQPTCICATIRLHSSTSLSTTASAPEADDLVLGVLVLRFMMPPLNTAAGCRWEPHSD